MLVEHSRRISYWSIYTIFVQLGQDGAYCYSASICVQDEFLVIVRVDQNEGFLELGLKSFKQFLLAISPLKGNVLE